MPKPTISILALLACTAACSADDADPDTADRSAPGYLQIHEAVLSVSCSAAACHSGTGIAGLSFDDPQASYDHLLSAQPVNANAHDAGMKLVVPGDADASFFLTKMLQSPRELSEAGLGGAMPLGAPEIPGPQTLDAVRAWIDAGAPYDGGDFEADLVAADDGDLYTHCDATDEAGMHACFGPEPDPNTTLRLYTKPMQIGPGEEVLFCNALPFTAEQDLLFNAVRGAQMRGGHHAGVFVSIKPLDDLDPQACGDDMSHLRYTAAAGGAGGKFTELPPGVALRVVTGQQLVIQSHYINSTDVPITVMDMVELDYTTPEESPTVVEAFAMLYDALAIPAGATGHSQHTDCTLEEDMDIYMLLGHTHEYGVLFEFERFPGGDGPAEKLYHATDGKLLRESPEIKNWDDPLKFKAGDMLRVTCQWDNTTDHEIGWPEEMCVALMYYGPGRGWLTCTQDDGVPQGGTTEEPPTDGCVTEGEPGNELGVGKYCTATGNECVGNGESTVCLAQFDDRAPFCTYFGCETDDACGEGAVCSDQGAAKVCLPVACA